MNNPNQGQNQGQPQAAPVQAPPVLPAPPQAQPAPPQPAARITEPYTSTDAEYLGSSYNLLIKWETGEMTWEPLNKPHHC